MLQESIVDNNDYRKGRVDFGHKVLPEEKKIIKTKQS